MFLKLHGMCTVSRSAGACVRECCVAFFLVRLSLKWSKLGGRLRISGKMSLRLEKIRTKTQFRPEKKTYKDAAQTFTNTPCSLKHTLKLNST